MSIHFPVERAYAVVYLLAMQRKAALALSNHGAMAAGRKSDKNHRNGISARNYSIVSLPWSIARTYVHVNTANRHRENLYMYDKRMRDARERHTPNAGLDLCCRKEREVRVRRQPSAVAACEGECGAPGAGEGRAVRAETL